MTVEQTNLGELGLGEPRLTHLWGLAHVDVALCQRPLGEGLRAQVLAGLAAAHVSPMTTLPSSVPPAMIPHVTAVPLTTTSRPASTATASLALHASTTTWKKTKWGVTAADKSIDGLTEKPEHKGVRRALETFMPFSPAVGPFTCPMNPEGGMGGITRLKGMGMFMEVIGLGPVPIMPIWSWVWKYMLDMRPAVGKKTNFTSFWMMWWYAKLVL